jgi:hypothetical protein
VARRFLRVAPRPDVVVIAQRNEGTLGRANQKEPATAPSP